MFKLTAHIIQFLKYICLLSPSLAENHYLNTPKVDYGPPVDNYSCSIFFTPLDIFYS